MAVQPVEIIDCWRQNSIATNSLLGIFCKFPEAFSFFLFFWLLGLAIFRTIFSKYTTNELWPGVALKTFDMGVALK